MGTIDARLLELDIILPEPMTPVGSYVGFVESDGLIFISGQISKAGDDLIEGKVGADLSVEEGQNAARICGLNILAQLKLACGGDLDRVQKCVRLGGFVNCGPEFTDHPKVINGASDLMFDVFGDNGRHARAAVGAPSLPLNVAVEIDAVFKLA